MSKPTMNVDKVIGTKLEEKIVQVTDRDSTLYSLGIGFSQDPMKQQDYVYTYQLNDNFTVFPTFATCLNGFDPLTPIMGNPNFPQFSPFMILYAQHRLQMYQQKILSGKSYINRQQVVDILDKGKNALVVYRINSYLKNNEGKQQLAFSNDISLIIRGLGGFGFKGKGVTKNLPKIPTDKPDIILKDKSFPGQAFIYRLSGDYNPLHVDPNISSMQSFPKPILHGLASYGIIARSIVQQLLKNDSTLLKSYHARFVGHVFPGESYQISIWKKEREFIFSANVVQREKQVVIGSFQVRQQAKL